MDSTLLNNGPMIITGSKVVSLKPLQYLQFLALRDAGYLLTKSIIWKMNVFRLQKNIRADLWLIFIFHLWRRRDKLTPQTVVLLVYFANKA